MNKFILGLILLLGLPTGALAQKINALPVSSGVAAGDLTIDDDGTTTRRATFAQVESYIASQLAPSATTDTTNAANITSGILPSARLPNPSATTLGGIESVTAVSHQFLTSISTAGVPAQAQPAAADILGLAASATTDTTNAANISSGTLPAGRMPALTGDCTTTVGTVATTCARVAVTAESYGAAPAASGATNTAAINNALAAGVGTVTLNTCGTYTIAASNSAVSFNGSTYSLDLVIPSNTKFLLAPCVTLLAAAGQTNPVLIQNSNISGGNTNIEVAGGVWDGNYLNETRTDGTTFTCILRWFQNITNLSVHDSIVQNSLAWADGVAAITYGSFDHLRYIDNKSPRTTFDNFGGVNVEGPNNNLRITHISGNTLDDLVALLTDQSTHSSSIYVSAMAGYGAINNVDIEDIQCDASQGCMEMLRLIDSTANPMQNVVAHGIQGGYLQNAMSIGTDTISGITGLLRNITIEDVNVYQQANIGGQTGATIRLVGSYETLTLRSIRRYIPSGETPAAGLLQQYTVSAVPAGGTLVLDDVKFNNATTTLARTLYIQNGTISRLVAKNVEVIGTLNAGVANGVLLQSGLSTTITDLKIDGCTVKNAEYIVLFSGTVTTGKVSHCTYSGPTSPAASGSPIYFSTSSAVPDFAIVDSTINLSNGGSGVAEGLIYFTGSTGTTVLRLANNNFTNGANANIGRGASEAIRAISPQTPVPSGILTPVRGDIILDSSNNNDPYRYDGTAWQLWPAPGSQTYSQLSYQPGLITSIVNTKSVYSKVVKASTVDNIEGSAQSLTTCTTNPTITAYECGTDATCASPTTIGSVTITAAGQAFDGTVSNAAIGAAHYVAFAITAGACASLDIGATAQIHSN